MLKIIKRDGRKVDFDESKIVLAVLAAFNEVDGKVTEYAKQKAKNIANYIKTVAAMSSKPLGVEDIQDYVEDGLMSTKRKDVAKAYILYRQRRTDARKNTIDDTIFGIVDAKNEYWNSENANKNPRINSTQRDYMAGAVSTDLTNRYFLPKEIIEADRNGEIHFHDKDYFAQKEFNCDLINLDDMLQNGTVISETLIEKPKSFSTACTVATQVIAQVASSQYGGQSISLEHLAPFVNVSRIKLRKKVKKEVELAGINYTDEQIEKIAEYRLMDEIKSGIQTIQYQLVTIETTNGQAPFITIFMYLNEARDKQTKKDLAILIEEMIKQRIQGVKNEEGVYVAPAFPKLIYVLENDNCKEDTPYWYLTKLAAECSAKRLVPDYISEKKMLELKGDVYPCMGCVDESEVIDYTLFGKHYVESFLRAWNRTGLYFKTKRQSNNYDYYRDLTDAYIWDTNKNTYVKLNRIIKNHTNKWLLIKFTNGRELKCTYDHPFETSNGIVQAKDITSNDKILINQTSHASNKIKANPDVAWCLGLILCDGCYASNLTVSLGIDEKDIADKYISIMENNFQSKINLKEQSRGLKGNYFDLVLESTANAKNIDISNKLKNIFEGTSKITRHIPNEVFNWDYDSRLAFLAGMIDADGYINNSNNTNFVQIGSTNKELSIQQMLLAQSLNMPSKIYLNRYSINNKNKIRYRVEFVPSEDLIKFIVSSKKKKHVKPYRHSTINNECEVFDKFNLIEDGYSYDVTTESEHFEVSGLYSHNCRSFLTPDNENNEEGLCNKGNKAHALNYKEGDHKYYGRFNQGVVTISLPDIAFSSEGDMDAFWDIFNERTELCHKALQCRHKRLLGTSTQVAPILWQYGAIARLGKNDVIDPLLYDNYSTISLGFCGLYECVKYMTGHSHSDEGIGEEFGIKVMKALNDKCAKWRKEDHYSYSLYGTPMESTTYKMAKCLKKRFGDDIFIKLDGKDRNYITNSYHIPVFEKIDAFNKLRIESKFQELAPGGAISYIETPSMSNNVPALLEVIKYMYENIMYAEINTKSCYCEKCGYSGDIPIVKDEKGKLIWQCPNCGNSDSTTMDIAFRVCGYIGTAKNGANQGRMGDIHDRVYHIDDIEFNFGEE